MTIKHFIFPLSVLCYVIIYLTYSPLSLSLSLSLSTLSFKLIQNFLTSLHWWKYLCPKIHISYTLLISFLIYNYLHLNVTWKHSLFWFDRISDHNFLCIGMKIASDWAQFNYQNILQWNIIQFKNLASVSTYVDSGRKLLGGLRVGYWLNHELLITILQVNVLIPHQEKIYGCVYTTYPITKVNGYNGWAYI